MQTDVVVIGGGAAGLAAARESRRRGASATIVTNGPLGGDCTFTGCVPSKTVIEQAEQGASFTDAFAQAHKVIEIISSSENVDTLRKEGIEVIEGTGEVIGKGKTKVGDKSITSKGIVLALGSGPFLPPIKGLADIDPLTTNSIWSLTSPPKSLAIIGGGAIGCELGQALKKLGVEVTIIEMESRLLAREDPGASQVIAKTLISEGLDIRLSISVESAELTDAGKVLTLNNGEQVAVEQVLVATGRTPNTKPLKSSSAGIELTDRGFIETSETLQTNISGVYAAGDVTGRMPFTHAADFMGRTAAQNILSKFSKAKFKAEQIPWVTFTKPEVAHIGLTEDQAARKYSKAMVAELQLTEHDRAIAAGRTDGFIKLIAGPRPIIGMAGGGRLVGATIVADRAGEMISELALAIRLNAFVGRLAQTVHPYPTWSYGIAKTAAQFFTEIDGHKARPAKQNETPE